MRRLATIAFVLTGSMLTAGMAQAIEPAVTANLTNGQKIFNEGKGTVPACKLCHGDDGMGNDSMGTPRLAGQYAEFILKQLTDFATDKRTDLTLGVMNANAKGLSEQDRRDVAAYVSTVGRVTPTSASPGSDLKSLSAQGVAVGRTYLGLKIVNYGAPERGVPACRSCHDYNGRGAPPIYPMIGQQKYVYLTNQLKHWRDGSRANDPRAQMQQVARHLTDEDIIDVAAYLTNASPYTIGNSRMPERPESMKLVSGP
jgi:cytochrome c553